MTALALPLGIEGGADTSIAVEAARKRFRALPNGDPTTIDDLFAILLLSALPYDDADEEPDFEVAAAKVQMVRIGFGSNLPKMEKHERYALFALAAWRLAGHSARTLFRAIESMGHSPAVERKIIWKRLVNLYRLYTSSDEALEEECGAAQARLAPVLPEGFALRPHQLEAFVFAEKSGFRCIFGDEMGLGKTIEILSCIAARQEDAFPVCVVCPKSLLSTWKDEALTWLSKLAVRVVLPNTKMDIQADAAEGGNPIYIMTYAGLRKHGDTIQRMKVGTLVCDESHRLSNPDSQRSDSAIRAASTARAVLCATGTFMPNGRHLEAYIQLKMVHGRSFPFRNFYAYADRFCGEKFVPIGKKRNGDVRFRRDYTVRSRPVEFGSFCAQRYLRRTKLEVYGPDSKGMPPKSRFIRFIDLSTKQRAALQRQREEIRRTVVARAEELQRSMQADGIGDAAVERKVKKIVASEVLILMTKMRVALGIAKAPWFVDRTAELLEEGHEVLIFAWHNEVAQALCTQLEASGIRTTLLDGTLTSSARDARIAALKAGQTRVGVLTSAYREGLTLVKYNRMLFVERWHRPGDELQAEDRIHRIGQTRDVAIEFGVVRGTYDDVIMKAQRWKEEGVAQVDGSASVRSYDTVDDEEAAWVHHVLG